MVQRRRNMTSVDVYAFSRSKTARSFSAQCTAAYEVYSLQLAKCPVPIKATTSWTRIFVDAAIRPGAPSRIEADDPPDNFGFSDGMRCAIDPSILEAEPAERPVLYVAWLHARMIELAEVRGWNTAPLEEARDACRAAEGELHISGKPLASPDRRHTAVLTMTRDLEGQAEIELIVNDRRTGDVMGTTTAKGMCSAVDFRKMTRQMRWTSAMNVLADDDHRTLGVPGLHRLTATVGSVQQMPLVRPDWSEAASAAAQRAGVALDLSEGLTAAGPDDGDVDEPVFEPDQEVLPVISLIGGGPSAPGQRYHRVLGARLRPLAEQQEWADWWNAADQPVCTIQYYIGGATSKVQIRRTDKIVTVKIRRAIDLSLYDPNDLNPDPGAEAAESDAVAVIAALGTRFNLGAPPRLGDLGPDTDIEATQAARPPHH